MEVNLVEERLELALTKLRLKDIQMSMVKQTLEVTSFRHGLRLSIDTMEGVLAKGRMENVERTNERESAAVEGDGLGSETVE